MTDIRTKTIAQLPLATSVSVTDKLIVWQDNVLKQTPATSVGEIAFASIASLRANTVVYGVNQNVFVKAYYAGGTTGGGVFIRVTGTAADNGGTIIADAVGQRWARLVDDGISAFDFGAVGDGVANDTAAIQSAVTFAAAGKKTLNLVNGTYNILSQISITNEITIKDGVFVTPNWTGTKSSSVDFVFLVTGDYCTFQNVQIDGHFNCGIAIRTTGGDNLKVLNCVIKRIWQQGICISTAKNCVIDGNHIYDIAGVLPADGGSIGIYLNSSARFGTQNTVITNNTITDINWAGSPGASGLDGNGIQIQGVSDGAVDNGNPNDARAAIINTVISDNYIARCGARCVKVQDSYVTVTGNMFENAIASMSLTGDIAIANIVFDGNLVKDIDAGHITGATTVLNLVISNNIYQNLKREFVASLSGGVIQNASITGNVVYVATNSTIGNVVALGSNTRSSGTDDRITFSNNRFINVGPQTPDVLDTNVFAYIGPSAKNITFSGNFIQSRDRPAATALYRAITGAENIQYIGNTYKMGTNTFPYLIAGNTSITLANEMPLVKKIVRNVTIASGSTTATVTHNLGVDSFFGGSVIGFSDITGTDNDRRAYFQKFTLTPKNNPTNNVTYTVAPSSATQALVTLSGNPGASGFTFDLTVDLEMNGDLIPTAL